MEKPERPFGSTPAEAPYRVPYRRAELYRAFTTHGVVSLSVYAFSYVHAAPRDAAPAARRTRPGTSSPPHQSTSTTHEDRRGQRGACRDVR